MNDGTFNLWMVNHYAGNLQLGMEYRHFFLARHLRRMGHRVGIISASFHHLYTSPPEIDGPLSFGECDGVPHAWIDVPSYRGNGIKRLWNMISFTRKLGKYRRRIESQFGRPDAVLGSSPHPFVVSNLLSLKRRYRVPVLFEVRDLWPLMLHELGSLSPRSPLSLLFARLEKRGFKKCDRVISLWHSADRYMCKMGLSPERYVYLPNGIEISSDGETDDAGQGHPLIELVRERKRAGKFIIGYAGSHGLANPLDSIVDTCELLRERGIDDVEFFLVGDGPIKEQTVSRSKELGQRNIHFHPYVQKPVVMSFYKAIDVAFMGLRDLPLFKYGPTPNKLMDYLASATPIIYAINSSFDPVKEAGAGLSIEPDDPRQLLEAILKLKGSSREELDAMGEAGRRYAMKELNFQSLAGKLADVVHQCTPAAA